MRKVKLGIIGIGNMGAAHCRNVLAGLTPRIELVAIAERNPARLAWGKETLGSGLAYFGEGSELINSGTCEAVLIATEHYQHPELSMDAFDRGLHVLCEKPAGVYTKAVREVNDAAVRSGCVYALMYNQRTNGLYRKMHALMQSGELGRFKRVVWIITNWYRTQHYYDSGAWRATWAGEGGGVLMNQCPHNLDLLQWLCGMPELVHAFCHEGKWHNIEVEDEVTAYFEYKSGATGLFVASTGDSPGTNRLEINCERGTLVCEHGRLWLDQNEVSDLQFLKDCPNNYDYPPHTRIELDIPPENPQHVGVMNAFASAILDGGELVARGEEGINGLMLSNAIYLSSWLKETIPLPVDEDVFLRELDKRRARSRHKTGESVYIDAEGNYGK